MKIINCDLCKREIGRQVDCGNFISLGSGSKFPLNDFDGFSYKGKTISDLCSECYKRIADAQNKEINKILAIKE